MYFATNDNSYAVDFDNYMKSVMNYKSTPKGLTYLNQWGANRYAANSAFLALVASSFGINNSAYTTWGRKQVYHISI